MEMRCQHYQQASWCSSQCARHMAETFLGAGIADGTVQEYCPRVGDLPDTRSVTAMEIPVHARVP
ncbi:MAG: hypothetical protein ACPHGV_08745 [Synechococcus sp.]